MENTNIQQINKLYNELEEEDKGNSVNIASCTDTLKWYKSLIRGRLLSKDEERILFVYAKKGDKKARKYLIERNLRLVMDIAIKFNNKGASLLDLVQAGNLGFNKESSLLDLVQAGNIGLIEAVDSFDFSKNTVFSTFASPYIKGYIMRHLYETRSMVYTPSKRIIKQDRVKKTIAIFEQKLGREPTDEEIAKYLGISIDEVKDIKENSVYSTLFTDFCLVHSSLHPEKCFDGKEDINLLLGKNYSTSFDEKLIDDITKKMQFKTILANTKLSDEERTVINHIFGLDGNKTMKLTDLAEQLGLTHQAITKKYYKVMEKLNTTARNYGMTNYVLVKEDISLKSPKVRQIEKRRKVK